MNQVTLTAEADTLREVLISLSERRHKLMQESAKAKSSIVLEIISRQLARVHEAMEVIQEPLGENWTR